MGYRDKGGSRARWFLAGLGFGVPLAMLYAPRSGRDTRRYFSRKANKARHFVSDKAEETRDFVSDRGHELYDRGREVVDRGLAFVEDASELAERGRKYLRGYG